MILAAHVRRGIRSGLAIALLCGASPLVVTPAEAQWSTTYEQFYLQAKHNWQFRQRYQAADRLFNAFDFGHAILYETLWTRPDAPAAELEEKWYDRLTKEILVQPPRLPLEEAAIEIAYARLAPEAKQMFDWAHILHRQIYDVLADESLTAQRKDAEVARLIAYYQTRPDLAFSSRPKSMELMQEQPYSLAFRQNYPKFNGLIWAYHWLQVGLYEPLLAASSSAERQKGVRATVARFWQMLEEPTRTMPYQMPMTAAVAPTFATRYPEAAIIFDNLHSMHDVISDILANEAVPRDRKRAEILRAAQLFRNETSYVMPIAAWRTMALAMGIENMGGPAVGFLPELPTPSVTYGAVMEHDEQTGRMTRMKVGQMTGAMAGMEHENMQAWPPSRDSVSGVDHSRMHMPDMRDSTPSPGDRAARGHAAGDMARAAHDSTKMAMHMRMLADTGMRRHMLADTMMRRMIVEMLPMMPPDHRPRVERMLADTLHSRKPAARPSTQKPETRAPAKPDPHAGHANPPRPAKPPTSRAPATAAAGPFARPFVRHFDDTEGAHASSSLPLSP